MKLVDILARELTEWPSCAGVAITQSGVDTEIYSDDVYERGYIGIHLKIRHDQGGYPRVTRAEWESARAAYLASIQPARDPEIADVVDKPANPWRRNRGRKTPPVPAGVIVDYKLRDDMTCDYYSDLAEDLIWSIDGHGGDIMQWRYAEPQQAEETPMAQTIEQVIENAEAAAAKAFNPIALRDEYKRITLECEELSQQMGKLTDRMGDIEAALRAEGFALVAIDKSNR